MDSTPLQVFLASVKGSHINASDSNWSNIDGERLTVYHDITPADGCEEGQPKTSMPSMELPEGSAISVEMQRGHFLNIKGADKTLRLRGDVSPEKMQLLLRNLTATGTNGVFSTESTNASLIWDELHQILIQLLLSKSSAKRRLAKQLHSAMCKSKSNAERRQETFTATDSI